MMKVGDLVRYKHDYTAVGLITKIDPNVYDSVTYKVWVALSRLMNNAHGPADVTYNYQLEVISESR